MKRLTRINFLTPIPEGAVLVARPSRFGNPYKLNKNETRDETCMKYLDWLNIKIRENKNFIKPLIGKNLVCYCKVRPEDYKGYWCHAEILIDVIRVRY